MINPFRKYFIKPNNNIYRLYLIKMIISITILIFLSSCESNIPYIEEKDHKIDHSVRVDKLRLITTEEKSNRKLLELYSSTNTINSIVNNPQKAIPFNQYDKITGVCRLYKKRAVVKIDIVNNSNWIIVEVDILIELFSPEGNIIIAEILTGIPIFSRPINKLMLLSQLSLTENAHVENGQTYNWSILEVRGNKYPINVDRSLP